MARFILDVANLDPREAREFMQKIVENHSKEILTISCVDDSNHSQFHTDETKNRLTSDQWKTYNRIWGIDPCNHEELTSFISKTRNL